MSKISLLFGRFLLIILLTTIFVLSGCKKQSNASGDTHRIATTSYAFPAEFSKQSAVWLAWPTYNNKRNMPTYPVDIKIIRALQAHVTVKIAISNQTEKDKIINLLKKHNIPTTNVLFYVVPHDDIWIRDFGPIFLKNAAGNLLKMAEFRFNMWGYEQPTSPSSLLCANVSKVIAKIMKLDAVSTDVVSEGGDRSFNGHGVMITNAAVELQRNPGMTKKQLEQEYKRVLGVEKVIWVEQGVYDDALTFKGKIIGSDGKKSAYSAIGTGGHIDEFVRFVGPHTILLAQVSDKDAKHDPIAKINYVRMQNALKVLQKATDLQGKHFKIVRIPFTADFYTTMRPGDDVYEYIKDLTYQDGSLFPKGKPVQVMAAASYVNFLISNGVVIAPKYWRPGLANSIKQQDKQAAKVLQSLFPHRKIITINVLPINYGGGGIHCITQQEPETILAN